jgi:hypothetical protein
MSDQYRPGPECYEMTVVVHYMINGKRIINN